MRISDWSSDMCSSDLGHMKAHGIGSGGLIVRGPREDARGGVEARTRGKAVDPIGERVEIGVDRDQLELERLTFGTVDPRRRADEARRALAEIGRAPSELQSLMRGSYAVFVLKTQQTL